MTRNKIFILALMPLILGACQNTNNSESFSSSLSEQQKENVFELHTSPFYNPKYSASDRSYIEEKVADFTYGAWSDDPFIIYMSLDTALNYLFDNVSEIKGENTLTYNCPDDLSFIVNKAGQTITAKNYDEINLFSKKHDTKMGMIDEETTRNYVVNNEHVYTGGEDVVFDLGAYHLEIYEHESKYYIPFSVVNVLTFNYALWSSVNFNGTAFYLLDMIEGVAGLGGPSNTYMNHFYQGEFRKQNLRKNANFVEFNYNAFMFQLDYYYGFRDEKMVPFNDYLTENYPDVVTMLKSDNETNYCRGVEKIMEEIIGDGHTNTGRASSACSSGSFTPGNYASERTIQLSNDVYDCYMRRYQALGQSFSNVRYSGNTAIISFDGFYHAGKNFTKTNISKYTDDDGFALFYSCFKSINSKSNVENIIFDITCNGGGDTNALIPMLAFLMQKVEMTMYSPLTKLTAKLSYSVDTNLDGAYDENDCYQDRYNFYILTSHYSFSCANLFPQIAKETGSAKIIGEQSGGGACVVYYSATPDGKTYRISSNSRDGRPENPVQHRDDGIPVDYELSREYFYNDSYLNTFVNSLSN